VKLYNCVILNHIILENTVELLHHIFFLSRVSIDSSSGGVHTILTHRLEHANINHWFARGPGPILPIPYIFTTFSVLKVEAAYSSEILIDICQTALSYPRRYHSSFSKMFDPVLLSNSDVTGHPWSCLQTWEIVGFEVLTVVVVKSTIFGDITPCSPLKVGLRFGGTYCLHLQGRRISRARYQRESRWQAEQAASQNFGLYRKQGNERLDLSSHWLAHETE
jgi:hypothetical protein